jgi:hypothetical protein
MPEESKKITIEFHPGCFDNFDGTQEELDELMAEIQNLAESGKLLEMSTPVDFDSVIDDDNELLESFNTSTRTLQ